MNKDGTPRKYENTATYDEKRALLFLKYADRFQGVKVERALQAGVPAGRIRLRFIYQKAGMALLRQLVDNEARSENSAKDTLSKVSDSAP